MFIKDYRRLVLRRGDLHHVACRIRPHLQVTFIVVGRITTGLLAVKDRGKIIGSLDVILYHVVSEHQVDHGEVELIDPI